MAREIEIYQIAHSVYYPENDGEGFSRRLQDTIARWIVGMEDERTGVGSSPVALKLVAGNAFEGMSWDIGQHSWLSELPTKSFYSGMSVPEEYNGDIPEECTTALCTMNLDSYWAFDYTFPDPVLEDIQWHVSAAIKETVDECEFYLMCCFSRMSLEAMNVDPILNIAPLVKEMLKVSAAVAEVPIDGPFYTADGDFLDAPNANLTVIEGCLFPPEVHSRAFLAETSDIYDEIDCPGGYEELDSWDMFMFPMFKAYSDIPHILIVSDEHGVYPLDPQSLFDRVVGMANVYVLDYTNPDAKSVFDAYFRDKDGLSSYGCAPGQIRVFQPWAYVGDEESASDSPILDSSLIEAIRGDSDIAGNPYSFIARIVLRGANYGDVVRVSDLQRIIEQRKEEEIQAAIQAALDKVNRALADQAMLEDVQKKNRELLELLEVADEVIADERNAREEAERDLHESNESISKLKEDNYQLSTTNDQLKQSLRFRKNSADLPNQGIDAKYLKKLPGNLIDIVTIFESVAEGKVLFLNAAKRSAEAYPKNKNIDDGWQMIWGIINVLWDLYFKEDNNAEHRTTEYIVSEFKKKAGFELALIESSQTMSNPRCMAERRFEYKGQMYFAWPHVKGGTSELQLRLHYQVIRDEKLIIVRHFGKHLTISSGY